MAGKKFKSEASIKGVWDGKQIEAGTKRTVGSMGRLKSSVADVSKIMTGVFASQVLIGGIKALNSSVGELVNQFKLAQDAAAQYENSEARLQAKMKISGDSWDQYAGSIKAAQEAMYSYAGASDGETLDALSRLYVFTGDLDKSIRSLGATYDFMATTGMNVATASRYMAMAWEGETMMLNRYIPQLRGMSKEQARAGEFLKIFADVLGGQASAATRTYSGQIETLGGQIKDLRVALGTPINEAIGPIIGQLADKIHELNKSGQLRETKELIGMIANNIVSASAAIWGTGGSDGFIDGINKMLKTMADYTGSDRFTEQLQTFNSVLKNSVYLMEKFLKAMTGIGRVMNSPVGSMMMPVTKGAMSQMFSEHAAGGLIPGKFDGDKIPLVGQGEYIINPTATQMFKPLLDLINFELAPSQHTGPGYASGGLADYLRRAYPQAQSLDWIIEMAGMGAQGLAQLESFMSRNVAPSSIGAANYAASQLRREFNTRDIEEANKEIYTAMVSSGHEAYEMDRKAKERRLNAFRKYKLSPLQIEKLAGDGGAYFNQSSYSDIGTPGYYKETAQEKREAGPSMPWSYSPDSMAEKNPLYDKFMLDQLTHGQPMLKSPLFPVDFSPDMPMGLTKNKRFVPGAEESSWFESLPLVALMELLLKRKSLPISSYGSFYSQAPMLASGGIVPGPTGQRRWILAEGGEEWSQPRSRTNVSRSHGFDQVEGPGIGSFKPDETTAAIKEMTATFQAAISNGNVSEAMIGRAIMRVLSNTGVDVVKNQEDLEQVKKTYAGFSHG